jgi:hypothetical protein
MQRLLFILLTLGFLFGTTELRADNPLKRKVKIDQEKFEKLSEERQREVLEIQRKLNKAFATDRSELSSQEKKDLKKEIKSLKKDIKRINKTEAGGVIYISVGAVLLIVLLILLL